MKELLKILHELLWEYDFSKFEGVVKITFRGGHVIIEEFKEETPSP